MKKQGARGLAGLVAGDALRKSFIAKLPRLLKLLLVYVLYKLSFQNMAVQFILK
jgi:hypothetical protein